MQTKVTKFLSILLFLSAAVCAAEAQAKFNYAAQKALIPSELGRVYLGMPFDKFAKEIDLSKAEVGDTRFDWLDLTVPVAKGNIQSVRVRVHGLTQDDKARILKRETVTKTRAEGQTYEGEIHKLLTSKIPAEGFVYEMNIEFNQGFDLKKYSLKKYGKGETRKPSEEYRFFDTQWTKRTSDGLAWLIRSFHERDSQRLQLIARIEGTEWAVD
ncbi:MAG: hypothetical protein WBO10_15805 [Pyrinomonadaceae bacterium]